MAAMTPQRYREFITEGTRTGKLATTRADGRPHVVPVWFVLDGDDLMVTTGADSVKGRALRREPRVAVCVEDDSPPYAFALIEGTVTTSEDHDAVLRWATASAARYVGPDRAGEYGRLNAQPGEMLVRITPTHIVTAENLTGQ